MAIAVDASSPARVTAAAVSAVTASFTPANNSLIVVCVSATGGSQANPTIAITNSGTALTWVTINRATRTTTGGTTSNDGCAYAAYAVCTSHAAMTVTATQTTGSTPTSIKAYVLTGVDLVNPMGAASIIGISTANTLTTTAITTLDDNSFVMCAATEWSAPSTTAPTSSNLTADPFEDDTNLGGLSGYILVPTAGTAQTCNADCSGTAAANWMYVVFEVAPAVTFLAAPPTLHTGQTIHRAAYY